jgi:hypothetical protein
LEAPGSVQSIVLHDADNIWTVELPIELEIGVYNFWAISIYRAEILPLKDEQSVIFPYVSTHVSLLQKDRADQGLVDL